LRIYIEEGDSFAGRKCYKPIVPGPVEGEHGHEPGGGVNAKVQEMGYQAPPFLFSLGALAEDFLGFEKLEPAFLRGALRHGSQLVRAISRNERVNHHAADPQGAGHASHEHILGIISVSDQLRVFV
jgi:hypothetical protein